MVSSLPLFLYTPSAPPLHYRLLTPEPECRQPSQKMPVKHEAVTPVVVLFPEMPALCSYFASRTRMPFVYRPAAIAAAFLSFCTMISPAAAQIPLVPAPVFSAATPPDPAGLCEIEVARQERLYGIPARLLHAISLAESGRYDSSSRTLRAWPWTVMAEGRGRYLSNRQEAVAEVRALQAKGIRNIDVGCMQVNLRAHPDAFETVENAFEPAKNVAYAARFLSSLYDTTGDWTLAASYYHSQTPHLATAYRQRLVSIWEKEKGTGSHSDDLPQNNFFQTAQRPNGFPAGKSAHARVEQERLEAERLEAKRIAEAYREARIREYQYRRAERLAARPARTFLPSPASQPDASVSSSAPAVPATGNASSGTTPVPPPFAEALTAPGQPPPPFR